MGLRLYSSHILLLLSVDIFLCTWRWDTIEYASYILRFRLFRNLQIQRNVPALCMSHFVITDKIYHKNFCLKCFCIINEKQNKICLNVMFISTNISLILALEAKLNHIHRFTFCLLKHCYTLEHNLTKQYKGTLIIAYDLQKHLLFCRDYRITKQMFIFPVFSRIRKLCTVLMFNGL